MKVAPHVLAEQTHQTYLVGGAVRDALMGLPVQDRDWVVVGATKQTLMDLDYLPVGRDFPVFLHPQTHEEYALARTERKTGPGYRGFTVHASPNVTLEEDLARRDLTINSIAARAGSICANGTFDGELVDPYGGQADIANKVLRHVTEAFREDPVRILRVARFAARFTDFSVAPDTMDLMRSMVQAGEVDHLVPERVWQELAKGLMEARPSHMLAVLRDCGALARLLPELDRLWGVPQRADYHPEVDTGAHMMLVMDMAAQLQTPLPVRFACLTHDLGKGTTPTDVLPRHIGHEERSVRLLQGVCQRLRVPVECAELAQVVAREHGNIHRSGDFSASATVRLLERCDAFRKPERFAAALLACECDARGRLGLGDAPYPQAQRLALALRNAQSVATDLIAARAISTGASGPKVGEAIHQARVHAVAGDNNNPMLSGVYAPVQQECELTALPLLHGRIPTDLNGVYLRAGPNARFAPDGRYHPFDGDGMVHAAQFASGKLTYRNRWVRTDGWLEEDKAGQTRFSGIRETLKDRPDKRLKDTANTDIVAHAGKAMALWYMAGDAYELDPITLQTLGKSAAILASGGHISAHAKVDETLEDMMFFDYGNQAPYMHYGVVGPDGVLKHHVPIDLPGPRLPHDMGVTEHYTILHDLPLLHDPEAKKLGRHKVAFYPDMPARFGVMQRYGASHDIRWFNFSACYVYHVVNSWEEGDWVVMVGCRYLPAVDAQGQIDAQRTAKDIAELVMRARLWEWRMNLATGATEERVLDATHNVEFPCINSRYTGRRTQFGYLVDHSEVNTLQWRGLRKYDLKIGQCLGHWSDDLEHSWYSEPCFAAADKASCEDHGYLIAFQWNEALQRQTLDIFNAQDLSKGPVAQVLLPQRVPVGFHACWMAADRAALP